MKISCKCITYGRVNLLEEALHSFLIQDYPEELCELIIVNDYPLQSLKFDHPQVKIYNTPKTFPNIGEKENYALERCSGDVIAVWDDDDIYLPWHLKNISEYFTPETNILHWKGVFFNDPEITAITGIGNSGMVYSKKAWELVGKHPIMNAGGDSVFSEAIKNQLGGVTQANPPDDKVSAFYMWGGRSYHQSGQGTDVPGRANIIERHSAHIEGLRKLGRIPTGNIQLKPRWNRNYTQMLSDFINGTSRTKSILQKRKK